MPFGQFNAATPRSKVDDLRFNALRAVQCGYAAFKCDVVAVISLAFSCTTLRVTALLRSMTFGSKVDDLRFNALRAVQCGYAAFKSSFSASLRKRQSRAQVRRCRSYLPRFFVHHATRDSTASVDDQIAATPRSKVLSPLRYESGKAERSPSLFRAPRYA